MFPKQKAAILFGLCSALAACDSAPTRDLTSPDPEAGTLDAQSVSLLAPSNTWATKSPMLAARWQMKAGTINSIIYVVAGRTATFSASTTVQAYNVASNSWSTRKSLPSSRFNHNGASVISGRLYVAGGQNSTGAQMKTLYVYSPGTNTWVKKADMPQAGSCGAEGVIGGLLYVYVSCTDIPNGQGFFRYNPATNTWVTRAAPPTKHVFPAAGVIAGKFYLAGGHLDNGNPNLSLHVYNPATNSWATKAPLPGVQIDPASAVINGRLFVAGGRDQDGATARLRVYNPGTNTWTTKASMPTARSSPAGAVAGALLFVMGGMGSSGSPTRKVEAYTP